LRPRRGDGDLLEREVVLLRRRREQPAEGRPQVLNLADPELLGDRLGQCELETGRVLDRGSRGMTVPEPRGWNVEADDELSCLLGWHGQRPGAGRRRYRQ